MVHDSANISEASVSLMFLVALFNGFRIFYYDGNQEVVQIKDNKSREVFILLKYEDYNSFGCIKHESNELLPSLYGNM